MVFVLTIIIHLLFKRGKRTNLEAASINKKKLTSKNIGNLSHQVEDVHVLTLVAVHLVAEDGDQVLQMVVLSHPTATPYKIEYFQIVIKFELSLIILCFFIIL